jgi:hypothetical protein
MIILGARALVVGFIPGALAGALLGFIVGALGGGAEQVRRIVRERSGEQGPLPWDDGSVATYLGLPNTFGSSDSTGET